MARVLVLGAGLMGPAIPSDLLKHGIAERVVIADIDPGRVGEAVRRLGPDRCEGMVLDVWNRRGLVDAMRGADLVAGAYPVAAVARVTEAAIEAGVSLADLTESAEGFDIFTYHDRAVRAGVTLLGCGVAPGLTDALVGQGAARLDRVSEGVIYGGGLPLHPRPPLGMLLRGRIGEQGVAPLEKVFAEAALYEELRAELGRPGMTITERFEEE
ncbi:MAG: saccharopine dehydrogenase NADP-binding domain-containing protein [Bacillota bacterium]